MTITGPERRTHPATGSQARVAANAGALTSLDVLAMLLAARVIDANIAQRMRATLRADDARHPFVQLAAQEALSSTTPSFPLTVETITRLVAEAVRQPYLRIDPLKIDVAAVTGLVSQAYATRWQFLPVAVTESQVTIATAEPNVNEWEREIAPIVKRRIQRVLANPVDIKRYLREFYGVSHSMTRAASSKAAERPAGTENLESLTQLGDAGEPDANDRHIVHLVDWLLQYAFEQRASDIHIEPRREQSNIRFRIDGVLHLVNQMSTPVVGAIVSRVKTLGRLDVADKRRPQDGRLKTKTPRGKEVELRLSTMPTTFGEKLVMRIFDPEKLEQPFPALGFTESDLALWSRMVGHRHGLVLVTGPTGSGKTTTLYSALRQLASAEVNVCTIEDPIEMVEPAFNQMQVQPTIDLDFASGVRTLLRQDPDIIMVGEIRDRATAEIAIQAALTGHLVLSTLHTNDAPSAVSRLMDLGVEPYLIGATLLGVVAQRLVRTVCPHCKAPSPVDPAAWLALIGHAEIAMPEQIWSGRGCDECRHSGFLGREGIYEIMVVDARLRESIGPACGIDDIRRAALACGMRSLRVAGAAKIAAGRTTLTEVMSIVPPPDSGDRAPGTGDQPRG